MCWNQYVSMNTFVFSTFVLLLIMYNNKYSPYKIKELDNVYVLVFLMSFFTMQLIEFFIWRNLHNEYNHVFSLLGTLLLVLQPIASFMLLKNVNLRNKMLLIYTIPAFCYLLYGYKTIHTTVSKTGHLKWNWLNNNFLLFIWIIFLLFSLVINKYYVALAYTLFLLMITIYSYAKDESFGSLWCWSVNSFMIFYAIKLLVVLPYYEHGIC
jgi:hypothetical protein